MSPSRQLGSRSCRSEDSGGRSSRPVPAWSRSQRCPRIVTRSRSQGPLGCAAIFTGIGGVYSSVLPCNGVPTTVAVFQKRMLTERTRPDLRRRAETLMRRRRKTGRRQPAWDGPSVQFRAVGDLSAACALLEVHSTGSSAVPFPTFFSPMKKTPFFARAASFGSSATSRIASPGKDGRPLTLRSRSASPSSTKMMDAPR